MKISMTMTGYLISFTIFIVHSIDNSLNNYALMIWVNHYLGEIILFVITSIWFIFDNYLWKFNLLTRCKNMPPNISGNWQVKIKSNYEDNKEVLGKCTIKQTYSKLEISILFEKSYSTIIFYHFQKDSAFWFLYYGYKTDNSEANNGSSHTGFATVKIDIPDGKLSGNYVTDYLNRETHGKIIYEKSF